jgi:hypothetical protein
VAAAAAAAPVAAATAAAARAAAKATERLQSVFALIQIKTLDRNLPIEMLTGR